MYFLLKMVIFHCYVSLPEGIIFLKGPPMVNNVRLTMPIVKFPRWKKHQDVTRMPAALWQVKGYLDM